MGVLNDYTNAAAVNAALNKGVEANKAVSELKEDLSDLFEKKNSFNWIAGAVTSTGHYDSNSTFNNYTSRFPFTENIKKISFSVGSERQVCVAKYNKATGAFVERTSWTKEHFSLNNDYHYVFNIATITSESIIGKLTVEQMLKNISIKVDTFDEVDTSNFALLEPYEKSCAFVLGNITQETVSNYIISIVDEIVLNKGITLTAKDGYNIGVYIISENAYHLVSGGWKQSWKTTGNSNYTIVFKNINNVDLSNSFESMTIYDVLTVDDYSPFVVIGKKIESNTSVEQSQVVGLEDFVNKTNERFDNISVFSKWHNKKVAFIGDSITYGVNTTKTYHQYLDDMIGFSNKYVDGIAGSSYSSQTSDSYTPIVQRVSNVPTDRDLVVIFGGTNDFGHSTPLGTIDDTTDVSFYGAVTKTIVDIITANPTVRLVIMTPLHRIRGNYIGEDEANTQGKVLKDYVDALKEVCTRYSIPIIDTNSIYGLTPRIPTVLSNYITDGLHPNTNGHKLLAERISPILETL